MWGLCAAQGGGKVISASADGTLREASAAVGAVRPAKLRASAAEQQRRRAAGEIIAHGGGRGDQGGGSAKEARHLLERMKSVGYAPDVHAYNVAIDAQAKQKDGSAAAAWRSPATAAPSPSSTP